MGEPRFLSPVGSAATADSHGVILQDLSGTPLQRRFRGDTRPGTAHARAETLEWSTSPGEWTVAGGDSDAEAVDLTHVRAVFRVSGPRSVALLGRVCSVDLSQDMFPKGAVARTLLAGVAAEVVRDDRNGSTSYLVVTSRSFGRHLWDTLLDATEGLE